MNASKRLGQTPSQTVGPYFAYGLVPEQYGYDFRSIASSRVRTPDTPGQPIRVEGVVYDGNGVPISDALIEIWQADGDGRYPHPAAGGGSNTNFRGFGRCGTGTDPDNKFMFDTVKPGQVDGQAPHISVIVLMRGLLLHTYTRIYFDDEAAANARDAVLSSVPDGRRATLIAKRVEGTAPPTYRFDIHMQGDRETIFFDV
jgi:protocatechuate 3,4-dioxygenase alpha subunit